VRYHNGKACIVLGFSATNAYNNLLLREIITEPNDSTMKAANSANLISNISELKSRDRVIAAIDQRYNGQ
jgi:hypothetical protein